MTDVKFDVSDLARKIRLLLDHAQGTNSEAEAATYWEAAQKLMAKHEIDLAMVNAAGQKVSEEIVKLEVEFPRKTMCRKQKYMLAHYIAKTNTCKVIDSYDAERFWIVGYESSAKFTELLFVTLSLQAWKWHLEGINQRDPAISRTTYSNNFLAGFAERVYKRLYEQNKRSQQEAEQQSTGVALALRDQAQLVEDEYRNMFPDARSKKNREGRYHSGAYGDGIAAGDRADLSGGARGLRNRKELGR